MKRYVILGGGISGLSSAWKLSSSIRADVTVIEQNESVGGWVQSKRTDHGSVFELGPRSLRTAGAAGKQALNLIAEMDLGSEILPASKAAKTRYIWSDSHGLVSAPSSLRATLKTVPPLTVPLYKAALKDIFVKRGLTPDESVYDFFNRRFGNEIADFFVDPLCRGIYAGKAKELSIKSCFPQLFNAEQKYGSVIIGSMGGFMQSFYQRTPHNVGPVSSLSKIAEQERWSIYTLRSGLQSLPNALYQRLMDQATIMTSTCCNKVEFTSGGTIKVHTDGATIEADHLVSSLSAGVLARLLKGDSHRELQQLLSNIMSITVAVVNLEYNEQVLPPSYQPAFGYLVPSHQAPKILGVVFDSSVFPEQNGSAVKTRLTVLMGGAWFEEVFPQSPTESEIETVALDAIQHSLGITQSPSLCHIKVCKDCIPQYTIGHSSTVDSIEQYIAMNSLPLTLVGSSFRGVSVNDCIHNAMQAVSNL